MQNHIQFNPLDVQCTELYFNYAYIRVIPSNVYNKDLTFFVFNHPNFMN